MNINSKDRLVFLKTLTECLKESNDKEKLVDELLELSNEKPDEYGLYPMKDEMFPFELLTCNNNNNIHDYVKKITKKETTLRVLIIGGPECGIANLIKHLYPNIYHECDFLNKKSVDGLKEILSKCHTHDNPDLSKDIKYILLSNIYQKHLSLENDKLFKQTIYTHCCGNNYNRMSAIVTCYKLSHVSPAIRSQMDYIFISPHCYKTLDAKKELYSSLYYENVGVRFEHFLEQLEKACGVKKNSFVQCYFGFSSTTTSLEDLCCSYTF